MKFTPLKERETAAMFESSTALGLAAPGILPPLSDSGLWFRSATQRCITDPPPTLVAWASAIYTLRDGPRWLFPLPP